MTEVEAKFSISDRDTFDRLCQLNELIGYRLEPAGIKQVRDHYLDTDDQAIMRAGYALRLRRKASVTTPSRDLQSESVAEETLTATLKGLGGADAASGIHQRAEHEVPVNNADPTTWPDSSARDLALQLSGGQRLRELFSLSQERSLRLLYDDSSDDVRRVAELSLDTVAPGGYESHPYFELEIELLDQGNEADLHALADELRTSWGLPPEPRSKFERGLALIDAIAPRAQQEKGLETLLTADERIALQVWMETGSPTLQRRARIILLDDAGQSTSAIAAEVGLSPRQVRRWRAAFRQNRMGIFPTSVEDMESGSEHHEPSIEAASVVSDADVEPGGRTAPVPVTVEELCAHANVDIDRAKYVKDLALQLFDLTADIHGLSHSRRSLLGTAAILHDLSPTDDRGRRHLASRDLILAQPISGFERIEQDILASMVAFQRKKIRRRRETAFTKLSPTLQQETLALAALLRMATGLNASETKSTAIDRVEGQGKMRVVIVEGPAAENDAAAAQRRANLWHRQFDADLVFMTEAQLAKSPRAIALEIESVPLPELKTPGLLPDDPMSEAGRKTLWFHFLRMLKHEPGTRVGDDIEELHDMRVATRRMRAAIRVFGDFFDPDAIQPFNKGIRRVTRALGPVRDLDVFEEKAAHYLETLPEADQDALDPLIETWHTERKTAREKMLAFLDSNGYHQFKGDFAEFLQTEGAGARPFPRDRAVPYQVRHVAPRLIYTRYETVRAYETILEDAQIETLHALRIDCKYLRYTLEFLREVLGPEGEAFIDEVKTMQDHLGDLNDAEVAISLLSGFLSDWDVIQASVPLTQRRSGEGIVTYLASRHAEKHRLLTTFPEAWEQLNRDEVRRWLGLAVAAL